MTNQSFLHESSDFKALLEQVRVSKNILEPLVEKDYWIMHCLWGLQNQGFDFELKGGTSLSKGYRLIDRFSEDIDIKIKPPLTMDVPIGKNHQAPKHVERRLEYFDWLAREIKIPGITTTRDTTFDDKKARNGGIRLTYPSHFSISEGIKPYVLLEVGFDATTPNRPLDISSWASDFAEPFNLSVADNRAIKVLCYEPGYTFVEKLSAISRKFRQEQEGQAMPINFIRHYYDVYQLLQSDLVLSFIGTEAYYLHKQARFGAEDEPDLKRNKAFTFRDSATLARYSDEYDRTKALYYTQAPTFKDIISQLRTFLPKL